MGLQLTSDQTIHNFFEAEQLIGVHFQFGDEAHEMEDRLHENKKIVPSLLIFLGNDYSSRVLYIYDRHLKNFENLVEFDLNIVTVGLLTFTVNGAKQQTQFVQESHIPATQTHLLVVNGFPPTFSSCKTYL